MTAPTSAALQHPVQPVPTAGNDLNMVFHVAPRASTVTSVTYVPLATVTGAGTNNRTVSLVNLGQSGAGTTIVATLTFAAGVNATAGQARAVTLSATPANLALAAGDVLQWQSVHNGTGIADPGGLVSVGASANYA